MNELELIAKDLNKLNESITIVLENILLIERMEEFKSMQKNDVIGFLNRAINNLHQALEIVNYASNKIREKQNDTENSSS